MFPMSALRLAIGDLLAAEIPLAQAAENNIIALVVAPFALDEALVVGDLTYADFDGSTPLEVGLTTQQVGIDPATGEQILTLIEPVGGWRWEVTGVTNLPQTVYGFALLTDTSAALLAVQLLDEPVNLTIVGHEINIGQVTFRVLSQPLS